MSDIAGGDIVYRVKIDRQTYRQDLSQMEQDADNTVNRIKSKFASIGGISGSSRPISAQGFPAGSGGSGSISPIAAVAGASLAAGAITGEALSSVLAARQASAAGMAFSPGAVSAGTKALNSSQVELLKHSFAPFGSLGTKTYSAGGTLGYSITGEMGGNRIAYGVQMGNQATRLAYRTSFAARVAQGVEPGYASYLGAGGGGAGNGTVAAGGGGLNASGGGGFVLGAGGAGGGGGGGGGGGLNATPGLPWPLPGGGGSNNPFQSLRSAVHQVARYIIVEAIAKQLENVAKYRAAIYSAGANDQDRASALEDRNRGFLTSVPLAGGILGNVYDFSGGSMNRAYINGNASEQDFYSDFRGRGSQISLARRGATSAGLYGAPISQQTAAIETQRQAGKVGLDIQKQQADAGILNQLLPVGDEKAIFYKLQSTESGQKWLLDNLNRTHLSPLTGAGLNSIDAEKLNNYARDYNQSIQSPISRQFSSLLGLQNLSSDNERKAALFGADIQNIYGSAGNAQKNLANQLRPAAGAAAYATGLIPAFQLQASQINKSTDPDAKQRDLMTLLNSIGGEQASLKGIQTDIFMNQQYGRPSEFDPRVQSLKANQDVSPETYSQANKEIVVALNRLSEILQNISRIGGIGPHR